MSGGQLELGSRDAQEAEWVVVGQRSRFVGVDDVVRNGGDAGGFAGARPQCAKGINQRHKMSVTFLAPQFGVRWVSDTCGKVIFHNWLSSVSH